MPRLANILTSSFLTFALFFCPSTLSSNAQTANGVLNPSMGLGLNGIKYWGPNFPFINLMKQASRGVMTPTYKAPKGLPYIRFDEMNARSLLDINGWPTSIPKNYSWSSIVTADAGHVPSQKGRYVVQYRGEGKVRVSTNGKIENQTPGEIVFTVNSDTIYIRLFIEITDPENTGDYIRDITVVKEENEELHQAGQTFNPQWLNLVKDIRVLRFMNWQHTTGSQDKEWSTRSTLNSNSWGSTIEKKSENGVPIEILVELANQVGADPWFCIPFYASDDYVRKFSTYVADNLDPELTAYFEYSNEVWNWIFAETRAAQNAGLSMFGNKFGEYPLREYYGYRSAEISQIVHHVFGKKEKHRIHFTLATQTVDNHHPLSTALRGAEYYLQQYKSTHKEDPRQNNQTVSDLFKSVAGTWYFHIPNKLSKQIASWIKNHGEATAIDMIFEQLSNRKQHFLVKEDRKQPNIFVALEAIKVQAKFAQRHGLSTITYEGGTHLLGQNEYHESLADFFVTVNNDPRMGELYQQFHKHWEKIPGATLLNHFHDVGKHSKFGSWGALRHLEDKSARWDFITSANKNPGDWERRSKTAFDQGITTYGTGNSNTIRGTAEEDFLIGKDGDDEISGGDNNDGLHGGEGNDTLSGGKGNDTLVGGKGNDTLSGGPGQDRFIFTSNVNDIDTITDFDNLDLLDIRPIIFGVQRNSLASDFLSIEHNTENITLKIDRDGRGNYYSPRAIATLPLATNIKLKQLEKSERILFH